MNRTRQFLRVGLVGLASIGLLLPGSLAQAANGVNGIRAESNRTTYDVALLDGGILQGQVVDTQGNPKIRMAVSIRQADREVTQTSTNLDGHFMAKGLPGGTYQVVAGESQGTFRLWASRTAPPSAFPGALVVCGEGPVRGQFTPVGGAYQGPLAYWLSNPWILGGLVATAIVVPVAIHNHQADRNSKPATP